MDARRPLIALLAAAGLLAAAPAAQAAYAPKLAVTVNPTNTPGKTVAFTSVVTQASDEDPTKSARVKLPLGFSFDTQALTRFQACSPVQRDARACPAASRLGTATANALGQTLTGGVHLGQGATIYIFLNNDTLRLLGQEPKPIVGRTEFRPDGGTDTVLDDLPSDFTATRFELALDGPPKSVIASPIRCGEHTFVAEFTSSKGVKATSSAKVTLTNCPPPPPVEVALSAVTLSPRSVVKGRQAFLRYRLNRAAQVDVTVRRIGKSRILGRKRFAQPANRPSGRVAVATAGLSPGRFVVTIRASGDGTSSTRNFILTVRARR
jgi:hypothetical protein